MIFDSATADRWTSIALFALGVAMLIGGYTMDRLEIRQIHPASIPGLVPMILGAAMMLCAGLLFLSARAAHSAVEADRGEHPRHSSTESGPNLFFAASYSVVYALALVGSMPFALATAIYIAVFYIHFTWDKTAPIYQRLMRVGYGIGFAVIGAYAIASLFQYGFLVRLP